MTSDAEATPPGRAGPAGGGADGLSMSELAEATGIPVGTIKTRARLALRALRQYLGSDEQAASEA